MMRQRLIPCEETDRCLCEICRAQSQCAQALRERDEAREKLWFREHELSIREEEADEFERERDKARAYIIAIWDYCGEDLRAYAPRLHEEIEQELWFQDALKKKES